MSNKKTSHLSKEQLIEAVRRKKICNARAQSHVESMLERHNSTEEFLKALKEINQSHYEDIVDERSIIFLCGYPLCSNNLSKVPAKQYEISMTTNKVYDITERKKFCSTHCFKASEYIKTQMLTSPLWLRYQESIPEFKLLE